MTAESTPPGWYNDPHGVADLRYWDGTAWTEHTHDRERPAAAVPVAQVPAPDQPRGDPTGTDGPKWGVLIGLLLLIVIVVAGITTLIGDDSDSTTADTSPGSSESVDGGDSGSSGDSSSGTGGAEAARTISVELTQNAYSLQKGQIIVADGMVWVTSPGAVSVLDESTGELIDSIAVESTEAAQLSARDGRVWLAAPFANSLTVIDTASREVVTTIVLPQRSFAVTEMPLLMDGYAWVASTNRAGGQETRLDLVTVIDTATFSVVASFDVGEGVGSLTLVNGTVWLRSAIANEITAIDVASLSVVATIPSGDFPDDIIYSAGAVWVANSRSATVSVIDPSTYQIVDEIAVGTPWADGDQQLPGPRRIYSEGTSIWVTLTQDDSLKGIDTASREVVDSIPINGMPLGFTESMVWVPANSGVAAIDLSTHEIVEELTLSDGEGWVYDLAATTDAVWTVSDNNTVNKITAGSR